MRRAQRAAVPPGIALNPGIAIARPVFSPPDAAMGKDARRPCTARHQQFRAAWV